MTIHKQIIVIPPPGWRHRNLAQFVTTGPTREHTITTPSTWGIVILRNAVREEVTA